jgi:hypothetical protein
MTIARRLAPAILFVEFTDADGVIHGSTSVAVQTSSP